MLLNIKTSAKIVWLGLQPEAKERIKKKKGITWEQLELCFHTTTDIYSATVDKEKGEWLIANLEKMKPQNKPITFGQLKSDFEMQFNDFELFWYSKQIVGLREHGLLVL